MRTIVIPPHPGALSALGLASAAERVDLIASFHRPLDGVPSRDLAAAFAPLLEEGGDRYPAARCSAMPIVDSPGRATR